MREFELIIDEAFKNGLSPEETVPFNSQLLWECLGFRCGKLGLEAYVAGENPLPVAVDIHYTWPFPQFIMGERYNFLIVRDSTVNFEDVVYLVSDDMATVTHIFSVDVLTFGQGTLMEVADFGEYAFMTNGVIMIYWDTTIDDWTEVIAHANIPMMRTICNFKGQAVGGNIVSAWYDCDDTFYVWSQIGEISFTPEEDNEAGYRRCPYGGVVYHVRKLGDAVVGYSSKGITLLTPVGDPVSTLGFKELSNIGLVNKGAMNGDEFRQVYVGEDLIVRGITKEGIKEFGYQHLMEGLNSEDIIVGFNKSNGDFYIGNSSKTYLLSPNGMTEIQQHPSAVWKTDANEVSMLPETEDAHLPLIITEVFNMGYSGKKTIATIETDAVLATDPGAGIDWADNSVTFTSENYKPMNNQGVTSIDGSGDFFRFRLRFSDIFDTFRISYMKVRYKMTDLRAIRGVYAPPLRGQ